MRASLHMPGRARKDDNKVAFVPAVNTVKCDLNYDLDGQHIDNTLWFLKRAGAPDIESMTVLAEALNAYWIATMMPLLSADLVFRGVTVTDQTTETGPAIAQPVIPQPGGNTSGASANNVAFVITFLTGGRGRSSRGRNYVPGIPDDKITKSRIDSSFANDLVDAYNGILASTFDADWEWSVVSHFLDKAPRTTGLVQPVIGTRYFDLVSDSMRRRLPGRGT